MPTTTAPAPAAADTPAAATYSIGDLAQEFDLTTRAIRFYEDMGLLQPSREGAGGRVRVYTARDRTRLRLTLRAKRLGLSLVEARELLDMYDSPRDTAAQLRRFQAVLGAHRAQLEARMAELQANIDEVKAQEKDTRALLARMAGKKDTAPRVTTDASTDAASAPASTAAPRRRRRADPPAA